MKKTILVSALALAFSSLSMAAEYEWVDNPTEGDHYFWEDGDMAGSQGSPFLQKELQQKSDEWVYDGPDAVLNSTNAKFQNLLIADDSHKTIVNQGRLWVIGSGNGVAMDVAYAKDVSIINRGTIYVDGTNPEVRAMNVNPNGETINEGVIVVKGGVGMGDAPGGDSKTMINKGVISVVGNGIGINFREEGGENANISNEGTIFVTGDGTGVHVGATTYGEENIQSDDDKIFTNKGSVIATGSGNAIAVDDELKGITLNFEEKSKVQGTVDASNETTLNYTNNTDTLQLVDDAKTVNLINSNVTIALGSDKGLDIDTVNADKDSSVGFSLSRVGTETDK